LLNFGKKVILKVINVCYGEGIMNSNVNNYKTGLYKAISWGNYMKGKFKNCIMLLTLLLLLSVVNGLTAYAAESSDPYVNITNKTLYRGYKNYQIKIENLKKGSTVSYTTSNSKVAKVSKSGIISPIGKGKAIITINIKQNNKSFKDKINVTVKNPYIIINSSVNVLEVGSNVKLKAKIYGMDGNIKWSVSDKEIATINSSTGKLTAKKPGKVSVIAKCKGIKDSCEIEINTPYDNYKDIWSYTFVSNSPYMTLYSVEQSPNKNI
jgi:hypothetical protein